MLSIPGYLTNYVKDPTGAGDSFAGAFFGYLDRIGNEYTFDNIFVASVLATIVASHTVEGFGSEGFDSEGFDSEGSCPEYSLWPK